MPEFTQKQIASKYKDDLTYYKKTHGFRRLRFWLTVVAFVGGLVWAMGFSKFRGSPQFFNTGPISQNHIKFANDCAACHIGASTDMLTILPVDKARAALAQGTDPLLASLKQAGSEALKTATDKINDPAKLAAVAHDALSTINLDKIDQACLNCHGGMALHQPGTKAVKFRESQREMSVVAAMACSHCHHEHIGSGRMKVPTSETCTDCHGNESKLFSSHKRAKFKGAIASDLSQNVYLGDFVQWLPRATEGEQAKIIKSFAKGHPTFLYETLGEKDNAKIKFNHARHFAADISGLNGGQQLDCRQCHVPDADGVGMQRITYDQHCQKCHSFGIDPDLPGFNVPHHDPRKVRDFLSSLFTQWKDYTEKNLKVTDAPTIKAILDQRGAAFTRRWGNSLEDVQRKLFYVGDPPIEKARNGQFLPACIKCHEVKDASPVPIISRTNIPDGWLTRGPYKHAAHLHLDCKECHAQALGSQKTEDILLPPQQLCADCHRPREYTSNTIAPTFGLFTKEAADKQRKEGGVFDSCLGCHKYHVPSAEVEISKALAR